MKRLRAFSSRRDQDGVMLIEAVVSVMLLAVALAMTVIIVGVLTKNVARTTNTGTSADEAQSALLSLESYVNGAVSPVGGAEAELQLSQVSNICWGSSNVSNEETSGANGWSTESNSASVNQAIGIIYARDFSMMYCGYGSDVTASQTSAPNVYEIYVNTKNATGQSICTANNYCPLVIVNLTPFIVGTQTQTPYATSDYPDTTTAQVPPAMPPVTAPVASTVGRVWCDQACQQLGISCSSINTGVQEGLTMPSSYTSLCPTGYSGTPPLFNYYTNAGVGNPTGNPTVNSGYQNPSINWVNTYTNTVSSPSNVNTTTSLTTTCLGTTPTASPNLASCGPLDMYSPADAQTLQAIQCVVLNMTVLGQSNPTNTSSKVTSVNLTDQVWLRDLSA